MTEEPVPPSRWLRRLLPPLVALAPLGLGLLAACGDDPVTGPADEERFPPLIAEFGLTPLPDLEYPQYNPYSAERVTLGRLLFFDPILGGESAPWIKSAAGLDPWRTRSNDVACATCHMPGLAFGDGRPFASGVGGDPGNTGAVGPERSPRGVSLVTGEPLGVEPRNSMTVLNAARNGRGSAEPVNESFQFLDGRVSLGLEVQATRPLVDRDEMAGDAYGRDVLGDALSEDAVFDSLTLRIRGLPRYLPLFRDAYPGEIDDADDIRINHVTKALAAYERELVTPDSRYDRFVSGDFSVFDAREKRGFEIFFGKAECGGCHHGPMLSDYSFHVQGVAEDYDATLPGFAGKNGEGGDFGRFHATERGADRFAFRTPTLRNIERTAPYFHAGSAPDLLAVVRFYDRGGSGPGDLSDAELAAGGAVRDSLIHPLGLDRGEQDALVAFLRTLTAPVAASPDGIPLDEAPLRVPSGLLPPGVPTPDGDGPWYPAGGD